MFLVRWARVVVATPVLLLGRAAAMFRSPASMNLFAAGWRVSGRGADGRLALTAIRQFAGPEAAGVQAAAWMARRPTPEVAAMAGLLAMDGGDFDEAQSLLEQGRSLGDDAEGQLDVLEFMIAACRPDVRAAEAARRFDGRRDLPPMLSQAIAIELLWDDMLAGRFHEAHRRADHLLDVADTPAAEMALWALALRDGDEAAAAKRLTRAQRDGGRQPYLKALALAAVGRREQARAMLPEVAEVSPGGAEQVRRVLDGEEAGA